MQVMLLLLFKDRIANFTRCISVPLITPCKVSTALVNGEAHRCCRLTCPFVKVTSLRFFWIRCVMFGSLTPYVNGHGDPIPKRCLLNSFSSFLLQSKQSSDSLIHNASVYYGNICFLLSTCHYLSIFGIVPDGKFWRVVNFNHLFKHSKFHKKSTRVWNQSWYCNVE